MRVVSDIALSCRHCGRQFVFNEGEQAFYQEHGYRQPTRCPDCRDARRAVATPADVALHATGRPMFVAVCFECGEQSYVPFKPESDRPVYCQACFTRRRAAR